MPRAVARHILVKSETECLALRKQIEEGEDFAELAKIHSSCPTGSDGGNLGSFRPGMMVAEFDSICFSAPLNEIHGPVKTMFGYHLIEILERDDG